MYQRLSSNAVTMPDSNFTGLPIDNDRAAQGRSTDGRDNENEMEL